MSVVKLFEFLGLSHSFLFQLVYPHPWEAKDLVIFNNRGLIHTVVGLFKPDQVRIFHQCGLAGSDEPIGPSEEDIFKWVS